MRKLFLLLSLLILTLILISAFVLSKQASVTGSITGYAVKNMYTKAICNENNYCRDYEVSCENGEVVSMDAVGEGVQFSEDWKDPRPQEIINKLC